MNDIDLELARKYKEALVELGLPVNMVYVFGSRVTGTANKWSDLDVCVVSPLFSSDRQSDRSFLLNISRKVSEEIEPHPMTKEDLNNKFNPLANEIRKHGIPI